MRGIFGRRTQRALDDSGNLIIIDRARPARASFIQEPFDAILQKPSTPFADRVLMNAKLVCSESRRRTAGWPDSAPIMTAPPDGPGPAASDMPVHPYSEPKPQLDAPLHWP
jgi:hypothetical protein